MRISDWSSDVCSSDLAESRVGRTTNLRDPVETGHGRFDGRHVFSTKTCDRQFLDEADVAAGTPHRLCDPEARLTLIAPLAHVCRQPLRERGTDQAPDNAKRSARSEERRVGKGWGSKCRSRWSPDPEKKKNKQ